MCYNQGRARLVIVREYEMELKDFFNAIHVGAIARRKNVVLEFDGESNHFP